MIKKAIIIVFLIPIIAIILFFTLRKMTEEKGYVISEKEFNLTPPAIPLFPDRNCPITDYGATAGGENLNTQAFARAIEECSNKGGGRVTVPAGVWLTGPIHLADNIDLHLDKDARVVFDAEISNYLPTVFSRFEGMEFYNYSPMIYARDKENIAITGEGELDGQEKLWPKDSLKREASIEAITRMAKEKIPTNERDFGNENFWLQPSFIQFVNCEGILIDGITIKNSPNWTIHPIYCRAITIRNIRIENDGQNSDGIAIDSSSEILITGSKIKSGDDAIAIKSGTDEEGRRINKPSENIIIRDIAISKAHSGLAIGSEMSGGVKNILARNLNFDRVEYGIRMKSTPDRGGTVENILVKDVTIDRALYDAIRIDLKYRPSTEPNPPTFKDIAIENLTCRRAKNAATFIGLPESPLKNIALNNIQIKSVNGIYSENLAEKNFKNISIETN